jgi:hypothetical protein
MGKSGHGTSHVQLRFPYISLPRETSRAP